MAKFTRVDRLNDLISRRLAKLIADHPLLDRFDLEALDDKLTEGVQFALERPEANGIVEINPLKIKGNSGEKPQSKVWNREGKWHMVFAAQGGTYEYALQNTPQGPTWVLGLKLSTTAARADVKVHQDRVHVLLQTSSNLSLASLQYSNGKYQFAASPGSLVVIPNSKSTETATLDIDTTGRMWIAYRQSSRIIARYSDGNYSDWSALPIDLTTGTPGVDSDDIAAVIAFNSPGDGGRIGVFWSNQKRKAFGFRFHKDVDPTDLTKWSIDESPVSNPPTTGKIADDHLHLAAAADGTLYVAAKTSYDSSTKPGLILLVRRPAGTWELLNVDLKGTRPIIALSTASLTANMLVYAYRKTDSKGPIQYQLITDAGGVVTIGSAGPLMLGNSLNNVSSTKGTFGRELVLISSDGSNLASVIFTL